MPFGWCPCALFIELSSLHLRKCVVVGQGHLPRNMHITYIPKRNIPDLPKGTQREYASKIARNPKFKKGKSVKHSVTGLSKSTSTTMAVPHVQKTSPCETSGNVNKQQSADNQIVHIPAVPTL